MRMINGDMLRVEFTSSDPRGKWVHHSYDILISEPKTINYIEVYEIEKTTLYPIKNGYMVIAGEYEKD